MHPYLHALHGEFGGMTHHQLFHVGMELQALHQLVQAMLLVQVVHAPPDPSTIPAEPDQPSGDPVAEEPLRWQLTRQRAQYTVVLSDAIYTLLGRPTDVTLYFYQRAVMVMRFDPTSEDGCYTVTPQGDAWAIALPDPYMFNGYPTNIPLTAYTITEQDHVNVLLLPE